MSPRTLHNEVAMPLMKCVNDLGKAYAWLEEANSRHLRIRGSFLVEAIYNQACCLCLGVDALSRFPSNSIQDLPPALDKPASELREVRLDLAIEKLKTAIRAGYSAAGHMKTDADLKILREERSEEFATLLGSI